jgi:hypothetical protein
VDGSLSSSKRVPLPFELGGPALEVLNLIEEDCNVSLGPSRLFDARPEAVPKAGERCLRGVSRGIESAFSSRPNEIEQKGGLSDLSRSC